MSASDDLKIAEGVYLDAKSKAASLKTQLSTTNPGSTEYVRIQKLYEAAKTDRDSKEDKYNKLKKISETNSAKVRTDTSQKTNEKNIAEKQIKFAEEKVKGLYDAFLKDPNNSSLVKNYNDNAMILDNAYTEAEKMGYTFPRIIAKQTDGSYTFVPKTASNPGYSPGAPANAPIVGTTDSKVLGRQQRGESTTATPIPTVTSNASSLGGKSAGKSAGKSGGKKVVPEAEDTSWEPMFKEKYGQYAWMLTDLDRKKYPGLFTLFNKAVKTGYTNEEFDRQFIGTDWYMELADSKKVREVTSAIGSFKWASGNFAKFVTLAGQYSWTGDNLKQEGYKALLKQTNNVAENPDAVKELKMSTPWLNLKKISTDYFYAADNDRIAQVLTGGYNMNGSKPINAIATEDDLYRLAKANAIASHPHLKDSIEAGLTLADLAYNYKKIAARTLELDENTIDFAKNFDEAINYTKDGAARVLSTSEWETELRTNSKYGYSFTKQANQDATSIGLAIARAFGKVG